VLGRRSAEPAAARPDEHALLAVAEHAGQLGHDHVGVAQEPVGEVLAGPVDECLERGAVMGETTLQGAGVDAQLVGDGVEAEAAGG
jgi:hypothetical protein